MHETLLSEQGTLQVPAEILKELGAKPGTPFRWFIRGDGSVYVRAKTKTLDDLMGMLKPRNGKTVSIEDMNPFR
ncbi:AbrB/MazE/SpoVT family DNA-binding domain-containing protein [Roseateles chitinivorans]|uniref:AbrB/MazE/SpoVT family DNA-binding domain-containing protein n=1 Tax=Roseateles chitinivorans TaxID=2917965 RepID=UPI003D6714DD